MSDHKFSTMASILRKTALKSSVVIFSLSVGFTVPVYAAEQNELITETQKQTESPLVKRSLNGKEDKEAKRLFQAISKLLSKTATQRHAANKLPSESDFLVSPLWSETKESRMKEVQDLLNAALDVVTDVPLVTIQKRIDAANARINAIENQITELRERRLSAPSDALLPGILSDTVASIDEEIEDLNKRISENKKEITKAKLEIQSALFASGIEVTGDQLELLLGSVLGGDLIKMVAAFEASRKIDERLAELMSEADGEIKTSRRYFAMHAALFAMLVHAQNHVIEKIDKVYMKRMAAVLKDIRRARAETRKLLRGRNRDDQVRVLNANLKAQAFSERVAIFYRDYLQTQRSQLVRARARSKRDLRIADNTYSTVEASFQLRALIDDAKSSFKALQMLEAPGFDQVFKNKELREEFENITEKLAPPSS
ncbi:MAG: hypothetical protein DHS20C07_18470 [Methyloligella sp.]|nr:MAG: hypothetical protein DHS20C07_18470 [Methyloligella sp.]